MAEPPAPIKKFYERRYAAFMERMRARSERVKEDGEKFQRFKGEREERLRADRESYRNFVKAREQRRRQHWFGRA